MDNPEIKVEYPVIMPDGSENKGLIKHYCEGYTIIQNETGAEYDEAIDAYPCFFTYSKGNPILNEEEVNKDGKD